MPNIDSIIRELDNTSGDIGEARRLVADLIQQNLLAVRDSLGSWEKMHLANAIAALGWNVNNTQQPASTAWLRLSVVDAEKALVSPDKRDESYTPRNSQLDALTYEQLLEELDGLRSRHPDLLSTTKD